MRALGSLPALALCLAAGGAHATPENTEGYGSRETALAGAVSADVPNGSAVFYNPSGLVSAKSSELALGYASLGASLASNGTTGGVPMRRGLNLSLLGRGTLLELPVAFGLAVGLSNGHLSQSESLSAAEPRWVLYDGLPELVNVGADIAVEPWPWLSLGGGVGFLAEMNGHFDVTGTARLSDGNGAEYDSTLRHAVNADLLAVRYPTLGVTARPHPALALAVAYRGQAELDERISGTLAGIVDAGLLKVPIVYDFTTESVIAFQPRELTFGASLHGPRTSVNLDFVWQEWSRYPSPVSRSGSHIQAELPPGFMLNLPANSELAARTSAHFSDRLSPHIGVEHRLALAARAGLALRGGYAYEPSPVPSHQSAHLVDAARHVFALGVGLELAPVFSLSRLELATHALWSHLPSRTLSSDAPLGPRTFSASGDALGAGLTLTLGFR
ncbi:MAG TPA: hypothetical protein VGM29_13135 [Polyangiaceae bacterium]